MSASKKQMRTIHHYPHSVPVITNAAVVARRGGWTPGPVTIWRDYAVLKLTRPGDRPRFVATKAGDWQGCTRRVIRKLDLAPV